jgi:hypothetical protein
MAQLRGESSCSKVIEPVVHGPGGQADPGRKLGRQMAQLGGETGRTVIVMTSQRHVQAKVLNGRPHKVIQLIQGNWIKNNFFQIFFREDSIIIEERVKVLLRVRIWGKKIKNPGTI